MVWKQNWFKLILAIFFTIISINIASASGLEPPLKVAWRSSIGTWFMEPYPISIELIESDTVYVNYRNLQAIDANDGKLLWSKDWNAGVAYKNGILYATRDLSSSLYALDARTGREIWMKDYPELKRGIADRYNLVLINETLFITTYDGMTNILAVNSSGTPVNIEQFPATSSRRNHMSTEAVYKNRLYIINAGNGKLYAYEHGYEVSKYMYFAIFCIILTTAYVVLRTKKYSERLQRSFTFSALFTVVVYSLVLAFDIFSNYFIRITDLFSISLTLEDWFLYLLFPSVNVITGTIAGMRIESKFITGVMTGVLPFLIVFWVSFFILPDSYYFFLTFIPFIISIYYIFCVILISGTTGAIIGFILEKRSENRA